LPSRHAPAKFVSPADPAVRWTGAHGGQAFFAYSPNYMIDVDNGIIVDVEATTAIRQAAVLAGLACRDRTLRCRSGLMALSVTVSRQIA
jgi:hypothetical protein